VIDAGAHVSRNNDGSRGSGIELGWQWPWGQSRRATQAQAQAAYQQSQALAEHTAIVARSQVRQAYDAYRTTWDLARHHRDEIVPLKKRISEENLLRYNAMLIGVFELLADARAQIMSVQAAIGAARDFWLADIDLQRALLGPAQLTLAMPVAPAAASMGSDAH
jgi:outer membrane protein TolC